jgi:nucleotide-binding universal stress UspA family protein
MRAGPVVIGFDGSDAAQRALREAGGLLAPREAIVAVVWEPGRAFQLLTLPTMTLVAPPTDVDIRTAMEVDKMMYESAQRLAEQGATLARDAGFDARGLAVADDITVADTLVRVAAESDAAALVVGAHSHGALSEVLLGSTSRDVVRRTRCPVLVVREHEDDGGHES